MFQENTFQPIYPPCTRYFDSSFISFTLDDPIDSIWLHHPFQMILGLAAKNLLSCIKIFLFFLSFFYFFFFFLLFPPFFSFLFFSFFFFLIFSGGGGGGGHSTSSGGGGGGARPPSAPLGYGPAMHVHIELTIIIGSLIQPPDYSLEPCCLFQMFASNMHQNAWIPTSTIRKLHGGLFFTSLSHFYIQWNPFFLHFNYSIKILLHDDELAL